MNKYFLILVFFLLLDSTSAFPHPIIKHCSFNTDANMLLLKTTEGNIELKLQDQMLIYSDSFPLTLPVDTFKTSRRILFPEETFVYPRRAWLNNLNPICLNSAGVKTRMGAYRLVPKTALKLKASNSYGEVILDFSFDRNIVLVNQLFIPHKDGYYSVSTPDVFVINKYADFQFVIPGYVFADRVNPDFVEAYAYEHGLPDIPVIYQDKCVTTPISILQTDSLTIGVAPFKSYPRKAFTKGENTHHNWNVGYAFMNDKKELSPKLYYPILGMPNSYCRAGDSLQFSFQYILSKEDWYSVYKQAIYEVFDFGTMRKLRNKLSLSERVLRMYRYMTENPDLFRKVNTGELEMAAQDYNGGIKGADGDAMKNSDYGAMWMLSRFTQNRMLNEEILPYALNFKLEQQYDSGKFQGAPKGQYYLWKSKRWVEEWGDHVEPIGITYYSLIDLANIALFEPQAGEVKERIRWAADLLLSLQREDGSWPLGIDKSTGKEILQDLKDHRPTFYGMYVAYKILGNEEYLHAALRGADWFVGNAVDKKSFLGVCGDTRFAPDFSTAMAVEALMDLYGLTQNKLYRDAALKTARYYTTYIYTHSADDVEDEENLKQKHPLLSYSQAGLACEHIGVMGSANPQGPILLSSFAGMFVRLYKETKDSLFLDMARAGANGRDCFVDKSSGIASYYWTHFNKIALPYPQHVWWQIAWITDYLLAEAELRSEGRVSFPRGFITPKVGPHKITGFAPGTINGQKADLILSKELVKSDNPNLEVLTAVSEDKKTYYFIVMNSSNTTTQINLRLGAKGKSFSGNLEAFGIKIITLESTEV